MSNTLSLMAHTALFETIQRLNWLYGKGDLEQIDVVHRTAYAKCTSCESHSFRYSFDGRTVKALGHQSRIKGMIRVGVGVS